MPLTASNWPTVMADLTTVGQILPESQYGAALNWGFFKNKKLALNNLHDAYQDDVQEAGRLIAPLAVAF